jgi:predicted dehydrogenase
MLYSTDDADAIKEQGMVVSGQKRDDQKTVKLAVIGAGAIGKKHATIAADLPECRLVGICDANPSEQSLADKFGATFYSDYEEMIASEAPDGVIIATPTELHAPVGITCARRGVHLFVEKPIASDLPDAQKLVESARENGVRLLVGHHRRFNPLVEMARRAIRQGKIGKLVGVSALWVLLKPSDYFQIDWRRQLGGGPVLINMIHDIDNMRHICGEIKRVYAETSSTVRGFEVEDSASVSLRFSDGALGTIIASDCVPSCWSYESTTGENPYYFRTHENCYIFFGTQGSLTFPELHVVHYANPQQAGWQFPLETEQIAVESYDPLVAQLKHFCRVIAGKEEPRTSGEDALRSLAVVRAILKSAKSGDPIELSG